MKRGRKVRSATHCYTIGSVAQAIKGDATNIARQMRKRTKWSEIAKVTTPDNDKTMTMTKATVFRVEKSFQNFKCILYLLDCWV